jgi:hypothetical protein
MEIPDLSMIPEVCTALLPAKKGTAANNHVGGLIVLTITSSYDSQINNKTLIECEPERVSIK